MSDAATLIEPDDTLADGVAFIDGRYMPVAEATVPLMDWGLNRSDLTYDVVAVWEGAFFRLEDHLDRFFRGIGELRMTSPHDRAETAEILHQCVARAGLREAYVKVILTRGIPVGSNRDPRALQNRFYAFAIPYVWVFSPEHQARGVHLKIGATPRISPQAVDPTVKNFHWGDFTRGLFEAYEDGADSVILTDGAGNITEGPGFNIFCAVDGRLITPAEGVLLGITRKAVIELAEGLNVKVEVGALPVETLRRADEIFLSTTAGGVMPVSHLDGKPLGDGTPGPLSMRLRQLYWEAHADPRYATPVRY
tara:strand:- start:288 stop:1211 length:924 start_codon:yes stop_codon:yes gene_type:complete